MKEFEALINDIRGLIFKAEAIVSNPEICSQSQYSYHEYRFAVTDCRKPSLHSTLVDIRNLKNKAEAIEMALEDARDHYKNRRFRECLSAVNDVRGLDVEHPEALSLYSSDEISRILNGERS